MAARDPHRRVLAYCYASLALRPTHAQMTEREFALFQGELVFWCPACGCAHRAARDELQLAEEAARAPHPQVRRSG